MRLLVTRPDPDGHETAEQLKALGHSVVAEPVSRIELLPQPDIAFRPAALVFTSRNAVRATATWTMAADWRGIATFVVGETTGRAAGDAGFSDIRVGPGDGAALVETISGTLDPLAGKIHYVSGRDRVGDLEERLASKGFDVIVVEAYAAVAAKALGARTHDALATGAVDGALFFSRRGAAIFCELVTQAGLAKALRGVTVFAISGSAGEPLRQFNPAGVRIAPNPDAKSLIAMIGR